MFQKLGSNRRHEVTWSIVCKTPPAHHQNWTSWKRSSTVIWELLALHSPHLSPQMPDDLRFWGIDRENRCLQSGLVLFCDILYVAEWRYGFLTWVSSNWYLPSHLQRLANQNFKQVLIFHHPLFTKQRQLGSIGDDDGATSGSDDVACSWIRRGRCFLGKT